MTVDTRDAFAAPQSDLESDADLSLMDAFIGESNRDFYRQRFESFEQGGGNFGWHWPAFFTGGLWLLHRKMWMLAFAYFFLVPIALNILVYIVTLFSPILAVWFDFLFYVALWIGFPTIASWLYYQSALRKIESVTSEYSDRDQQIAKLQSIGGTGIIAYFLGGLFLLIIVAGVVIGFLEA